MFGKDFSHLSKVVYHRKSVLFVKPDAARVVAANAQMHAFHALFGKVVHECVHKFRAVSLVLCLGQNVDMQVRGIFFRVHIQTLAECKKVCERFNP